MYGEALMTLLSGKERVLSMDLINSMMERNSFSSEKIKSLGFKFTPLKNVISETAEKFLKK
jgi:hypothetical protein